MEYCHPSIQVTNEMVPCIDSKGNRNHVLLMHIDASSQMHANHADEVFLRVGDKSKKLTFEDRLTLMYDKGLRLFEDTPVLDSSLDDIDYDFLRSYLTKINYGKTAQDYLLHNNKFVINNNGQQFLSTAAVLLFAKDPQKFFPRAQIRFIRYNGIKEKYGVEMNVIKDVTFSGRILTQIEEAVKFLKTQIREHTFLGDNGVFITEEEYPEFVCTEIIVNAVTHRDYSVRGTDIQIKMFNDRIVVESPGRLPSSVKPDNIRQVHFSRNPKIAEFLKNYKYVKEYGEGVDRMYEELKKAGLAEPVFNQVSFMLHTVVFNKDYKDELFENRNVVFGDKNELFENKNVVFGDKNELFALINDAKEKKILSNINANSLIEFVTKTNVNDVISRKIIKVTLLCSDAKAGKMITLMNEIGIIRAVTGLGKGKYCFVCVKGDGSA